MAHEHTPGPWLIEKAKAGIEMGDYVVAIVADERGDRALLVYSKAGSDVQADANARLIAAAPELLEALRKAVSEAEQSEFERWLSSEAPSGDHEAVHRQWKESANFQDFHRWWGGAMAAIAKAKGE